MTEKDPKPGAKCNHHLCYLRADLLWKQLGLNHAMGHSWISRKARVDVCAIFMHPIFLLFTLGILR